MQASARNTVCCLLKTLLVCALLHYSSSKAATDSARQLAVAEPDIQSLQLVLTERRALAEITNTVSLDRRQVDEPASHSCNDSQAFLVLSNLNSSCIDAISSVSLASSVYLSSDEAERHITDLCREDCAGGLIRLDQMCPDYFPDFATYLQGGCSLNVRMNRCAFSARDNNGLKVFQKCFEETNVYEGCRRRCKNALAEFNSDVGCCINSFYNATWDFFDNLRQFQPHLNYSIDPFVWETCGIPYPNECSDELFPSPTPSPAPTPITNSPPTSEPLCIGADDTTVVGDNCLSLLTEFQTSQGLQAIAGDREKTRALCSVECGGQYAEQCRETNSDLYDVLELFCGEYSGETCGSIITRSYSNLLSNLSVCSDTTGSCSQECLSTLVGAESELGCCLFLLTVDSVGQRAGTEVVDSRLWSKCGLQLPPKCHNPFDPTTVETTQSTASSKVWLAGVAVPVFLLVLVAVTLVAIVTIAVVRNREKQNKGGKRSSEAGDTDDMELNHSYSRVRIPNPLPPSQENHYSTIAMKQRGFMASSESLFEVLDNTPHVFPHRSHYDRVVGPPRVREEREIEENSGRGGGGREGGEDEASREREDDGRGFEYTTTDNIARHLRSDTAGGGSVDGGPAYANLSPALKAAAVNNKTVIYQEPHPSTHPSFHDGGGVRTPDSPNHSQQYNYIQSDLYHYPRTDNLITTIISNTTKRVGHIETQVNVSYMAGTNPHPTLPPTPSSTSTTSLATSLVPSANPPYQKPVAKPRKNSGAGVATTTGNTTASDDASSLDYSRGVRMTRNVSYCVPYNKTAGRNITIHNHSSSISEHTADNHST